MAPAPSASCLLYLFADRLLRRAGVVNRLSGRIGLPTPGTGVVVDLGGLEVQLLAVALWDLRLSGDLKLRRTRGADDGFLIVSGGEPKEAVDATGGLEGRLREGLTSEGASLLGLLGAAGLDAGHGSLPLNAIVLGPQLEAADLGVTSRPRTPHLATGLLGHHTFPPVEVDHDLLAELVPQFDDLAERWSAAQGTNRAARVLLDASKRALAAARPTGDTGMPNPVPPPA